MSSVQIAPASGPAESAAGAGNQSAILASGAPVLAIFSRADSTNTIARHLAEAGAPAGSVVIADEQTRGRGRGGKTFQTPPGAALLISIILRPPGPLGPDAAPGAIPLRIGLAAAGAVDRIAGTNLRLKWPNDLLLEGEGKVAGILCEGSLGARTGGYVVAGIGLNVRQTAAELPTKIGQPATSLRLATGKLIDRAALAGAISAAIARDSDQLFAPLGDRALAELDVRDPLRGHSVTVDGEAKGVASGIAPDGALKIRGHNGRIIHLRHGTVRIASQCAALPITDP
jgi:BirA family biotin operon repressor/biotin-[acetyl-CoA-carboxylase] ligase